MEQRDWIRWDGTVQAEALSPEVAEERRGLFEAAGRSQWSEVFQRLERSREKMLDSYQVNVVAPGDHSWQTLLHVAVLGGAPAEVVERLVGMGHFRSVRCAAGERPLDLARHLGRAELLGVLEPVFCLQLPEARGKALEKQFHRHVLETPISRRLDKSQLRLPQLEVLREREDGMLTFLVPYMFGGFVIRLQQVDFPIAQWFTSQDWVLLVRRFDRMGEGAECRYVLTEHGWLLQLELKEGE